MAYMYVCYHIPVGHIEARKKVAHPPKPRFLTVIDCHVSAGNRI